MQNPEFSSSQGIITCPRCEKENDISLVYPVVDKTKIELVNEIFCKNKYCQGRLNLSATYRKYRVNPAGTIKINKFLFNGEEKDITLYWKESN